MKVKLSSKTVEGLGGKIKNLAIQLQYGKGDIIEEETAEGTYTIEIEGSNIETFTNNVYNLAALFPS